MVVGPQSKLKIPHASGPVFRQATLFLPVSVARSVAGSLGPGHLPPEQHVWYVGWPFENL